MSEQPRYASPVDTATFGPYRIKREPGDERRYLNLWDYARDLYQQPAFRDSTDFTTFTAPGAVVSDWNAPHAREELNRVGV